MLLVSGLRLRPWSTRVKGFLMGVVMAMALYAKGITAPLVAAALLIRFRVNSTWLILGGAAAGLLVSLMRAG